MKEEDMDDSLVLDAIVDVMVEELGAEQVPKENHDLPEALRKVLRAGKHLRDAAWRKNTYSG